MKKGGGIVEQKEYTKHELMNQLLAIVQEEEIQIKRKKEFSFTNNAAVSIDFNYRQQMTNKTIFLPAETDADDIEQAISIAHELGHYFSYKNSTGLKLSLLQSNNIFAKYMNERLAWKEAERLLKHLGYWSDENIRSSSIEDRIQSLSSYTPYRSWFAFIFHTITNPLIIVVRLWVFAFITYGLLVVFAKNGVPIPILG